jgi:tRNA pseudouridine38-40 synthase
MPRYKLTIAYDGTAYSGWQVQPTGTAIQPLIQQALATILRSPVDLTGSGRTDAGVHARGQTAHFDAPHDIAPSRIRLSLNALLPPDIRILKIDPVAPDFHARYSATSKIYHYHLYLDPVIDPFTRLYRHQIFGPCDLKQIANALPYFVGTRDFLSFANEAHRGSASRGSVRTLFRLDLIEQKGGVRLEFEGNGFLYKMVRNITGVLLDVGAGKLNPEEIPAIFAAKDRRSASFAAPPHGLFLMEVEYGKLSKR